MIRLRVVSRPVGALSALPALLLLSLAAPALAGTAPTAASRLVASRTLAAAQPSSAAAHSAQVIPGVTGAAARENDPPGAAAQRLAQIKAAMSGTPTTSPAASPGAARPNVAPWSGTLHDTWGTFVVGDAATVYGAQAMQSINPGLVAPKNDADYLYAPTLLPSTTTSTIEVSTIYGPQGDFVGAWNWGTGTQGFAKTVPVDASFLASYATKVGSQYFYSVQILETSTKSHVWTAYLYNYKTRTWDTFYSNSGNGPFDGGDGWDMDEVYTAYSTSTAEGDYCTAAYGDLFESTGLKYKFTSNGPWTAATSANSEVYPVYPFGSNLGCADLGFDLPVANSAFALTNSAHATARLTGTISGKCADVSGGKFASGAGIQLTTCGTSAGQSWAYNTDGELTTDGGTYCLTVAGSAPTAGAKLELSACRNTAGQEWTFSIYHSLVSEGSSYDAGLCLDTAGARTTNGTPLDLQTCTGQASQKWAWAS